MKNFWRDQGIFRDIGYRCERSQPVIIKKNIGVLNTIDLYLFHEVAIESIDTSSVHVYSIILTLAMPDLKLECLIKGVENDHMFACKIGKLDF